MSRQSSLAVAFPLLQHPFHCCDKPSILLSKWPLYDCRDKVSIVATKFSKIFKKFSSIFVTTKFPLSRQKFFVATENLLLQQSSGHLLIYLLRQSLALSRHWLLPTIAKSVAAFIFSLIFLFFFLFFCFFSLNSCKT